MKLVVSKSTLFSFQINFLFILPTKYIINYQEKTDCCGLVVKRSFLSHTHHTTAAQSQSLGTWQLLWAIRLCSGVLSYAKRKVILIHTLPVCIACKFSCWHPTFSFSSSPLKNFLSLLLFTMCMQDSQVILYLWYSSNSNSKTSSYSMIMIIIYIPNMYCIYLYV